MTTVPFRLANTDQGAAQQGEASALRRFILIGALMIATLLLYQPVVHYQFVSMDDPDYVTDNVHVQSGLNAHTLGWAFTTFHAANWHPLTWISHIADYQLFGSKPGGHHYSNVLLHAANVVLLFLLLERATGARWRSLIVAALFALHPINIETVAWVAERKSLLSAFFSFLTIASYAWYLKKRNVWRYLVTAGVFALALMSKPMAVTLPAILLLLDYWPFRRFSFDHTTSEEHLPTRAAFARKAFLLTMEKVPLFFMSGISAYVTIIAQWRGGAFETLTALPLAMRLKNAAVSYVLYIQKAFWPDRLSVFYPCRPESLTWFKVAIAVAILGGITLMVVKFRRPRYLLVGWVAFLVTLVPVIGIVQVGRQAMADRYAYLPLIGIFIMVIWGAAEAGERLHVPPAARAAAAVCLLLAITCVTTVVLPSWQNSLTLFTRAEQVASAPDYTIEDDLGQALFSVGRYDEALQHFEVAQVLNSRDPLSHYNIGTVFLRRGKAQDAIREYQAALQSWDPRVTKFVLNNLGFAYLSVGNYQEAERTYTATLEFDPLHYTSLLGRGQAFYKQGKYSQAAGDFAKALSVNPQPAVYLWSGKALEAGGEPRAALAAYDEALRGDPNLAEAQNRIQSLHTRFASPD